MTPLDLEKLRLLRKQGFDAATPDEALSFAICAEQTCRDLTPGDPAWPRFKQEQLAYESLALLLEKLQAAQAKT